MKRMKSWINNRFVDADGAKISISDRSFLYGDAVFETMRSYTGRIFRFDGHMDRLFGSLKSVGIKPPYPKRYLMRAINRTLKLNSLQSAYIRITITRGEGRFGINYDDNFKPNVIIIAKEFGEYPDWMRSRGISAKVSTMRQNEYSPLSGIKTSSYLNNILARLEAKREGFDDAILLNTKGDVAEGVMSNIFLVKDKRLVTPSLESGGLPGITRNVIMALARRMGLHMREKRVSHKELLNADEVFFTNSLIEVLPVRRIDSKIIGSGSPGEITRLVHISYQRQVIEEVLF